MSAYQMTRSQFLQAIALPDLNGSQLVLPWKMLTKEDKRSCFHLALTQSIKSMNAVLFGAVWESRAELSLSVPPQLFSIYLQEVEQRRATQDPAMRAATDATAQEIIMASHLANALAAHSQTFTARTSVMMVAMGIPYLCEKSAHPEAFQAAWSTVPLEQRLDAMEHGIRSLLVAPGALASTNTVGAPVLNRFLGWVGANQMAWDSAARLDFLGRFLPQAPEQSHALAVEEMKAVSEACKIRCLADILDQWQPLQNWLAPLSQRSTEGGLAPREHAVYLGVLSSLLGYEGFSSLPQDVVKPLMQSFALPAGWEEPFGQSMAPPAIAESFISHDSLLVESVFILDKLRELEVIDPVQYASCAQAFVARLHAPLHEVLADFEEQERPYMNAFRTASQHAAMEMSLPAPSNKTARARF